MKWEIIVGKYSLINFRYGDYVLVEETAPEGYEKSSEPYKFSINSKGKYIIKNDGNYFTNNKIKGNISITKVEEGNTSKKLSGAEFTIYKDNGNDEFNITDDIEIGKMTDLSDGSYEYKDLEYGTYWVKETKAPAGYKVSTKKSHSNGAYKVVIDKNKETKIVSNTDDDLFEDTLIKGTVKIVKVDADYPENKLSGAIFKVYEDTDNDGVYTEGKDKELFDLDEKSEGVYSRELRYGKYFIKEDKAPEGFVQDNTAYLVNISNDGEKVIISNDNLGKNFINKSIKGSIKVIKVDSNNHDLKLNGAEFEIYKDSNNNGTLDEDDLFVSNLSESVDGVYIKNDLYYGLYFIKEVKAPENYVIDTNYYEFNINENNQEIIVKNNEDNVFVNKKKLGAIPILVVDEVSKTPIENAVVKVYNSYNQLVYEGKTDSEGKVNIEGLEDGSYTYKIEEVPEGYKVYNNLGKIDIKDGEYNNTLVNKDESKDESKDENNDVIEEPEDSKIIKQIDTIKQVMKTGDNSKLGILIAIAAISLIVIIAISISSKRRKKF